MAAGHTACLCVCRMSSVFMQDAWWVWMSVYVCVTTSILRCIYVCMQVQGVVYMRCACVCVYRVHVFFLQAWFWLRHPPVLAPWARRFWGLSHTGAPFPLQGRTCRCPQCPLPICGNHPLTSFPPGHGGGRGPRSPGKAEKWLWWIALLKRPSVYRLETAVPARASPSGGCSDKIIFLSRHR